MQTDMHYYGTYAIARTAGINQDAARRMADASQFVDDYVEEEDLETTDGALISYWPTGHSLTADDNFDPLKLERADPHRVWVPFHFLPGGVGSTYTERMTCTNDSAVAKAAIETVLSKAHEPCLPELAGIMAHIYGDTFSHYGFVGLHCNRNRVKPADITLDVRDRSIHDYLVKKASGFFEKLAGSIAATATCGLGHASVADFPDRPYLRWRFTYEDGRTSRRDNQATYMTYCEQLFRFFQQVKQAAPQYAEEAAKRDFGELRTEIAGILAYEAVMKNRCSRWQQAAEDGKLGFSDTIPEYDEETLNNELQGVQDMTFTEVMDTRVWHFTRAAELLRNVVIYELLPAQGLVG